MQAQVPFWLQLGAVLLAPILGLAGVGIGAYAKEKSDRRISIRAERREVYVRFVQAATAFSSIVATDAYAGLALIDEIKRLSALRDSITRTQADRMRAVRTEHEQLMHEVRRLLTRVLEIAKEIELVGTATPARCAMETANAGRKFLPILKGELPSASSWAGWSELDSEFRSSVSEFCDSARRDIGISRSR